MINIMKNEHIVQFLKAFPFNPSCNQLLHLIQVAINYWMS